MIRVGMVGGGEGAFIGAVHRTAIALDGRARVIAGALSSTPEKALRSAHALGLERPYASWQEMLAREQALPGESRIQLVSIVTPNHLHHEVASAFVDAGFNVMCDKPMTRTLAEATDLASRVARAGVVFGVTYNYTGYPMVIRASELVQSGAIGRVRRVIVEYLQGWLATDLAAAGQKQAAWRGNPALAGAGALGDIGTHAENLVSTITGLRVTRLCAHVATLVPGRAIDDDASVLLEFDNGARGTLTCSQVCPGQENGLSIRVFGETGAIRWHQEYPNHLEVFRGEARELLSRAAVGGGRSALASPAGTRKGSMKPSQTSTGRFSAASKRIFLARSAHSPAQMMAFVGCCL